MEHENERRAEDEPIELVARMGGDATTVEQLDADNPVVEDTVKSLDPNDSPA
jgi:hypothetical protein